MPESTSSRDIDGDQTTGTNVKTTLQSATGSAIETAKNVLSSAQQTIQPHVGRLAGAAQATAQAVSNSAAQASADTEQGSNKPSLPPATTAPLESSGGIVGGPYPATVSESDVGTVA